jgi:hypothetical protein
VSGSDDWRKREPGAHEREDGERAREIHRIFPTFRGVGGRPRIHAELRSRGIRCSRERTARLMREMELCAKPLGTKRRAGVTPAPHGLPIPRGSVTRPLSGPKDGSPSQSFSTSFRGWRLARPWENTTTRRESARRWR